MMMMMITNNNNDNHKIKIKKYCLILENKKYT